MSFTEKIDVLDLIIQTLKDLEQKMDELVERLETITEKLKPALPSEELEEDQGLVNPESSKYLEKHR